MEHQIPVTTMEQEQTGTRPAAEQELPDQIREIREKVASAFSDFKESRTYDRIIESKESARYYIRNNPLASLGYALGAGVLLGFILKKRR